MDLDQRVKSLRSSGVWITVTEAARQLGVSTRRVRALVASGRLFGFKFTGGGRWKVGIPLAVSPGKRDPLPRKMRRTALGRRATQREAPKQEPDVVTRFAGPASSPSFLPSQTAEASAMSTLETCRGPPALLPGSESRGFCARRHPPLHVVVERSHRARKQPRDDKRSAAPQG